MCGKLDFPLSYKKKTVRLITFLLCKSGLKALGRIVENVFLPNACRKKFHVFLAVCTTRVSLWKNSREFSTALTEQGVSESALAHGLCQLVQL